jgi:hypothetical protein
MPKNYFVDEGTAPVVDEEEYDSDF